MDGNNMVTGTVTLTDNETGKSIDLPVIAGSIGPRVIDIRKLYAQTGHFTYDPGFMATAACRSGITYIDGDEGILMYRGYPIQELAEHSDFLEVAYLLLNGELPNGKQFNHFKQQIASERALPKEVEQMMQLLPKNTHPMDVLRTGVSMLAPFDKDLNDHSHDANVRKAIRLIAKVMTLITDGFRFAEGQKPLPEKSELSQAANFLGSSIEGRALKASRSAS